MSALTTRYKTPRTTVGLKITTKDKLDNNKAPGQCYDGFIYQLVDFWERNNGNEIASVVSTAGGNQGAGV
ncbi:hypothetical protein ACFLYS_02330 [Chloroflexota bacterium]